MTSDKGKIARQQQASDSLASDVAAKFAYFGKVFAFSAGSIFNCNVHQYSLDENISAESFPFLPEIFFVKDCIEEITRLVAEVK